MMNLSTIFTQKPVTTNNNVQGGITYQEWGFQKAGAHLGSDTGLSVCLQIVHQQCIASQKAQDAAYQRYIIEIDQQIAGLRANIEGNKTSIQQNEEALQTEKNKIGQYNMDIAKINAEPNPETGSDSTKKWLFCIGCAIIFFLTVYLFVFYSSAAYSAFMKPASDITDQVADQIFDPYALSNAADKGRMNIVFILTFPFVFLGFGLVLHFLEEKADKWKYGLYLLAFVFDILLAYTIEAKIYELTRTMSSADFDFSIALQMPGFWLIIFSGFIVYVVWGILFGHLMNIYDTLDPVRVRIKEIKEKIKESNRKCNDLTKSNNSLVLGNRDYEGRITQLGLSKNNYKFNPNDVILEINNFFNGWSAWLSQAGVPQDQIKAQCARKDEFIAKL